MEHNLVLKLLETTLDSHGAWLLMLIRHQSFHREHLLNPRYDNCYVELNNVPSADTVAVVLLDMLTPAERTTRPVFVLKTTLRPSTIDALPDYVPITRSYLWVIPASILQSATPATAVITVNTAGAALRTWMTTHGFTPWRSPDWISQTDAMRLANVNANVIYNEIRSGLLTTWRDPTVRNPRHATRVRRSAVEAFWTSATMAPVVLPPINAQFIDLSIPNPCLVVGGEQRKIRVVSPSPPKAPPPRPPEKQRSD